MLNIADLRPVSSPSDPFVAMIVAMLVGAALCVLVMTARDAGDRTRRLLFLYLTYGVLEVIVKRLAHFSWFLYPIKIGLFFCVIGSWWSWREIRRLSFANVPFSGVLGAYLALAAVQVFNPIQANPVIGVFGWLSDFVFVAFYFVAFDLFDDVRSMRRLLYVTAILGVVSALACFAEQWIGPDELMRRYPTFVHLLYFTPTGVVHRPSLLSPYSEVFAIAAMLGLLESRRGSLVLLSAGIVACAVANLLHVVRIGWLTGIGIVVVLTVLNRRRPLVNAALIVGSVALAMNIAMTVSDGQIAGSIQSTSRPLNTFQETRLWGLRALPVIVASYPLGVGVGEASPGVRFLDTSDITSFGTHNYLSDLAGQMSIIGPLLLLFFSARTTLTVWRAAWRARPDEWRAQLCTGLAVFGALTAALFGGGGLGSYPVSDYFWLMSGASMGLVVARQRQLASLPERVASRPVHRRDPVLVMPRPMARLRQRR